MSNTNIDRWLQLYRMKEKLLVAPDARAVLEDPVVRVTFPRSGLGSKWIVCRRRLDLPADKLVVVDWRIRASQF